MISVDSNFYIQVYTLIYMSSEEKTALVTCQQDQHQKILMHSLVIADLSDCPRIQRCSAPRLSVIPITPI